MDPKLLRPLSQAVALALIAGGAHAAAITVTDAGDGTSANTCTLRQAIYSANHDDSSSSTCVAGSGADTITFASNVSSTITLTQGQLVINSNVDLTGTGQTIQRDPNASDSRVMLIDNTGNTAANVTLTNLTLTGGNYNYPGAGLSIGRHVLVRPAKTQGNSAAAPAAADLSVTLNQVTISDNTSNVTAGGVYIDSGATVAMNQCTVSGNTLNATGNFGAGGVYITDNSAVTITDSTVSGNSASGLFGYLTGGIYAYNSPVTLTNSTIANNSASGKYGIAGAMSIADGDATLYNSTVSGNIGSAINSANVATGGILVGFESSASLNLYNTILSGNTGNQGAPADLGVYRGSNVIAQFSLMGMDLQSGFTGNGNVFNDAPGLGALANNGGPTLTMKPQPGSPALGIGSVGLIPSGVTTDQRGVSYARVVNGALDIGSVEAAAGPTAVATPTPALSRWAMLLLGGLLALFGLRRKRQRES